MRYSTYIRLLTANPRQLVTVYTIKKKNRLWDLYLTPKFEVDNRKNRLFTILLEIAPTLKSRLTPAKTASQG